MLFKSYHALRYLAEVLVLLSAVAVILRFRIDRRIAWSIGAGGCIVFIIYILENYDTAGDLPIFWNAGRAVWSGLSPYADPVFVNPPTAFPLYAALAVVPVRVCVLLWAAVNLVGTLALVVLCHRCLMAHPDYRAHRLEPAAPAVLTPAVAISFAARYGVTHGQTAVFTACFLLGALIAQGRHRVWSGAASRWQPSRLG